MVTIKSLARRPRRGMLVSTEVLLLASAGTESARFGWLIVLNKRAKDMPKGCTGVTGMTNLGGTRAYDPVRMRK